MELEGVLMESQQLLQKSERWWQELEFRKKTIDQLSDHLRHQLLSPMPVGELSGFFNFFYSSMCYH